MKIHFRLCVVIGCAIVAGHAAPLRLQTDLGVKVAEGFKVTLVVEGLFRRSEAGVKIGPDGARYVLEGGGLLREGKAIAAGFRKARDFDFNGAGDLFTFDGDVASDFYLPWHVPARVFHIGIGQHHGADGEWDQPDYYPDNVDILVPIGRAAPRRVICYRHTQFPEEYRDSLFVCDGEFGKIYFCKLQRLGSTYRARTDLFFEAENFQPNDAAVAEDGSLLIFNGAKTFRIEHIEGAARGSGVAAVSKLQEVLQAPQPLDAWSRAKWVLVAKELGAGPFRKAVNDLALPDAQRIRAIETHVELFGAIPQAAIEEAARTKSAPVRARAAWALGWQAEAKQLVLLQRLALDTDAMVRRFALEGILQRQSEFNSAALLPVFRQNLGHPDKRLRQTTARLCARLPEVGWLDLWEAEEAQSVQAELSLLLAAFWREKPPESDEIAWRILETMAVTKEASPRQQALRLLQKSLGGWNLNYEPAREASEELRTNIVGAVRAIFPAGNSVTDLEASRLLAMLRDDSIEPVSRFLEGLVSPVAEFHYLIVLSRLRGTWPDGVAEKARGTLGTMESRLQEAPSENWKARKAELEAKLNSPP